MYAEAVLAEFPAELTHCLEERQRFDVTYGTADFGYHEVVVAGVAEIFYVSLDLVGDMGYDLHCLAQIVSAALFFDYALEYASARDIVGS